jgi:vanillate O-demethylase monooxygenase subunit
MDGVLRNAWYVAAWAEELAPGARLSRRLLDEPVVLSRDAAGHVVAAVSTRHCPLIERSSALWLWMGDPQAADPALLPAFDFLDPLHWAVGTGHMAVEAHYELETDNILDLSHIEFLHPLFASEAVRRGTADCRQEADTVWSHRLITDDLPPPFVYEAFGIPPGRKVDRWLDVRWNAPALMALWTGGVESGSPRELGTTVPSAHCFTPETATRTHYFYAIAFPRAMGPLAESLARDNVQVLRGPFEHEDKPMLEAVQRNMGGADLWSMKPVLLPGDAAAVRARRVLQRLIEAERKGRHEHRR